MVYTVFHLSVCVPELLCWDHCVSRYSFLSSLSSHCLHEPRPVVDESCYKPLLFHDWKGVELFVLFCCFEII